MKNRYRYTLEIYPDEKQEFRWRLLAHNGRNIANGSEGYKIMHGAKRAALRAVKIFQDTSLIVVKESNR
jgi:uncharacterized protein YegP (UPF0339 family)